MLDQKAILDTNDVRHNPVHWQACARIATMHDHKISLSHDRSGFVLQRWRDTFNELEQTLAARLYGRAVLGVDRRPVAFGRSVVPFVEESVKSLEDEGLVLFWLIPAH